MDLKNTKATLPKYIAQPSKVTSPQCTTEKPSAASKNTYKFHERGEHAELVVRKYFLSRGWRISAERTKFDGVEIDLIVEKENRRVLLEVKHLDQHWRAFERVGTKQIQRLKYVLLGQRRKNCVRNIRVDGYVVFVLPGEKLHFISLDETI